MLTPEKIIESKKLFLNLLLKYLSNDSIRRENMKNSSVAKIKIEHCMAQYNLSHYQAKMLLSAYQTALTETTITKLAKIEEFQEITSIINEYIDEELIVELLKTPEKEQPLNTRVTSNPLAMIDYGSTSSQDPWPLILLNIKRLDKSLPIKGFYEKYDTEIAIVKYSLLGLGLGAIVTGLTFWALSDNKEGASAILPSLSPTNN